MYYLLNGWWYEKAPEGFFVGEGAGVNFGHVVDPRMGDSFRDIRCGVMVVDKIGGSVTLPPNRSWPRFTQTACCLWVRGETVRRQDGRITVRGTVTYNQGWLYPGVVLSMNGGSSGSGWGFWRAVTKAPAESSSRGGGMAPKEWRTTY